MTKVKITIIKKMSIGEVYGNKPPIALAQDFAGDCPRLKVGDQFMSEDGSCPPGFCSWAFADIHRDITHLRFGGSFPWCQNKKEAVACCTDGLRPVFFKLERLE
jgi:uncharacterized repeat protein (TIGR04076 family)